MINLLKIRLFFMRKINYFSRLILIILLITFLWLYFVLTSLDSTRLKTFQLFNNNNEESKQLSSSRLKVQNNEINEIVSKLPINILEIINKSNNQENILNYEKYGPLKPNDIVIVIQVHNRYHYLKELIKSLQNANGINSVLIIFSHDFYDEHINFLIKNITFCKVMQIFYPFSIQLFPNKFPGQSPNDCSRNMKREEAVNTGCVNADWPDTYGHYREAKYTQTKHHWWWKINYIFDKLQITRNHPGHFMFLEEDHYVTPDVLHVLNLMLDFTTKNCQKCNLITLGAYVKSVNFAKNGNKVEVSKWISSKHNMGFVLERKVWESIKSCAKVFCSYDDYNWDWSLQYISDNCMDMSLTTAVVVTPRVFHIGECGVHHKKKDCNNFVIMNRVEKIIHASSQFLFPSQLILQSTSKKLFKMPKANGGWSDKRDHQLCLFQVK